MLRGNHHMNEAKEKKSSFFRLTQFGLFIRFQCGGAGQGVFLLKHLNLSRLTTFTSVFFLCCNSSAVIWVSNLSFLFLPNWPERSTDSDRHVCVCLGGPQPSVKGFLVGWLWGLQTDLTASSVVTFHQSFSHKCAQRNSSQRPEFPPLEAWELCIMSVLWQDSLCMCYESQCCTPLFQDHLCMLKTDVKYRISLTLHDAPST